MKFYGPLKGSFAAMASKTKVGLRSKKRHFMDVLHDFGGHESFHAITFSSLKLNETIIKLPCFDDNYQEILNPRKCNLKRKLRK